MTRFRIAAMLVAIVVAATAALLFAPVEVGVTRVHNEVDIGRSPHDVYAYVTTPAYWPQWHPSSLAVHGETGHSLL